MANSERLIDSVVRHQVLIERLKSGAFEDFNEVIGELDKQTREAILSLNVHKVSDLSKAEMKALARRLEGIAAALLVPTVEDFSRRDLANFAASEADFEAKLISNTFDATIRVPAEGVAFAYARNMPVSATGELVDKMLEKWTVLEREKLGGLVRKAYVDGQTTQDLATAIRGLKEFRNRDGAIYQTKRRSEAIARTAIQHVSNSAREKVWIDNSQIVEGYRWVSTLDGRTSDQCKSLDGRVFEVGKGPTPPIHYSCRSTTVAEVSEDLDFLDEGATRASKDGPVDADLTYYEWLKAQPVKFQEAAIGVSRTKLLRNGGLSAERFAKLQLNRRFEPLTLAQMKKLEPLAFERAGVEL